MRVLLISNLFPPSFVGGYELGAQDVAGMLAARGHAVTVLCCPALDDVPDPPTPYHVVRSLRSATYSAGYVGAREQLAQGSFVQIETLHAVADAVTRQRPDMLLLFNIAGLGPLGLLRFCRTLAIPTVAVVMDNWFADALHHGQEFRDVRRLLGLPKVFAGIDVIACSARVMAEVDAQLGHVAPTAAEIVPAWVAFDPAAPPIAADPVVRFVFSSRVAPHKGTDIVIAAAAMLQAQGLKDFQIDVFGAGLAGPTMQSVHANRLEHVIRYRGLASKPEMMARFADYDALLFATWEREPSGYVLPEAAAAGCIPILTANIGGAEYMLDEQDCLKIRRDPASLAAAMTRLIRMPAAERAAFRTRVRRHARLMFDARRCYDMIERRLRVAIARPAQGPGVAPADALLAMTTITHLWRAARG